MSLYFFLGFVEIVVFLKQEVVVREALQVYLLGTLVDFLFQFVDVDSFLCRDEHAVIARARHPSALQFVERYILACGGCEVIGILGDVCESVDLIEHHDHRLGFHALANILERVVDNLNLFFEIGMRYIYHMKQYVRLAHLVESRLERVDKVSGQLADKSYRVGEQEGQVVDYHLAYGGVECGEKLVFGEYLALAQEIHECGFAHIGVAYKCHAGKLATVFSLYCLLPVYAP